MLYIYIFHPIKHIMIYVRSTQPQITNKVGAQLGLHLRDNCWFLLLFSICLWVTFQVFEEYLSERFLHIHFHASILILWLYIESSVLAYLHAQNTDRTLMGPQAASINRKQVGNTRWSVIFFLYVFKNYNWPSHLTRWYSIGTPKGL